MTMYGQDDVLFKLTRTSATAASSATGMLPIQNYIDEGAMYKLTALTAQTDAFGDAYVENSYVGVRRIEPFTISGFYDDVAASGPHALFGNTSDNGASRNFEIDYGASDVVRFRGIVASYQKVPSRGALTRYTVDVLPSGAVDTATA